jgi:hypothetical protein
VGLKGVSYDKNKKKWQSFIKKGNKRYWLGYTDTPQESYKRYCEKAKELHGDFACVN